MAASIIARILSRMTKTDTGCWIWTGGKTSNGYGAIAMVAHKLLYLILVGDYDSALDLDHACRNRACCNPAHLEPVTRTINLQRGDRKTKLPKQTHCLRGHPLVHGNLYMDPNGRRHCRKCSLYRSRTPKADRAIQRRIRV